jgi:hypothetical protein
LSEEQHRTVRAATHLSGMANPEQHDHWPAVHGDPFAREVFHALRSKRRRPKAEFPIPIPVPPPLPPVPPIEDNPPPPPDFHTILGSLGDYPALLRRTGIVLDMTIDLGMALPQDVLLTAAVGADVTGTDIASWTQRTMGILGRCTGALAFPTDVGLVRPFAGATLDLTRPSYTIASLDADAASLKAAQAAPDVPAQSSAGLTVYHDERLTTFASRMNNADTINEELVSGSPSPIMASLSAVARGYRVDVKVDGAWHPLCARHVEMSINGQPLPAMDDEGYVKSTTLTAPLDQPDAYLLHSVVFGWDGWSLAAPRPRLDGTQSPANATPMDGSFGFTMVTNVTPSPGSVPLLRFGKTYTFRARAVDIAGNSVGLNDLVDDPTSSAYGHPTKATPFVRYEPVVAPPLLLRAPVTEGESLERLVVRSCPANSQSPLDLAGVLQSSPDKVATYAVTSERHVAPPAASLRQCEYHGALDPIVASSGAQGFANVARKSGGSYDDGAAILAFSPNPEPTLRQTYTPPFAASSQSTYPYYPTADVSATLPVPYLPDPNALTYAINDYLDTGRTLSLGTITRSIGAGAAWPDYRTHLIQLVAGSVASTPSMSAGDGSSPTVVTLPPGMMITARYSSALAPPDPNAGPTGAATMAHFAGDLAADPTAVALATAGKLEDLTPSRAITFVHAVPKPTVAPTIDITVVRAWGDTAAQYNGVIHATPYDTGSVAVEAEWNEPCAPSTGTSPASIAHRGHVGMIALPYTDHPVSWGFPSETFDATLRQEFGDTKHRKVTFTFVGHTRYLEYFPASFTADAANVTTTGGPLVVDVPSTARPAELRIIEVVPTFAWEQVSGGRARRGGGLRVYVDGDWFSSGEGEQLAVVLCDPNTPYDSYDGRVSGLSADPLWWPTYGEPLAPAQFHLNAGVETGISLPDLPDGQSLKATLVTYEPQFNTERGQWFFDIEITRGLYAAAFVRLALARYQKMSVDPRFALSKIAISEMTQILQDRTATVRNVGLRAYEVDVTGWFGTNFNTDGTATSMHGRIVEAELQEAQPTLRDPGDFGWTTIQGPISLAVSPNTSGLFAGQIWRGTLHAPPRLPTGAALRVVVREKERIPTDPQAAGALGPDVLKPGGPLTSYQERVVYTDAISI